MNKVCSKCKQEKNIINFSKDNAIKCGLKSRCKNCYKEYRLIHKEKIKDYRKHYYLDNYEMIVEKSKQYYNNNKDKITNQKKEYLSRPKVQERIKQYKLKNKDKINNQRKQYRLNNKAKIKQYDLDNKDRRKQYFTQYRLNNQDKIKQWFENNKKRLSEKGKQYYNDNKEKISDYQRKYEKNRMMNDPIFNLICKLRSRTSKIFRSKNLEKNKSFFDYIGCTGKELYRHIESKFTKDMSWTKILNAEIEIDHIIPLSSANSEEELYILNHFSNLQPLWKAENRFKSAKILAK